MTRKQKERVQTMKKYHVREYSDKLGTDFKVVILAEYDIDAETIVDAEQIIDAKRHHETKSISVFNGNGSLCANWAAEGLVKDGGEIKGKYYNNRKRRPPSSNIY